jgi:siroheme synthase (precorrin-2 oxidase/ferrochelatase)
MADMIGQDITQVLPLDDEEVVELTEEIRERVITSRMTPEQLDQLFYSCLRGYGWKG